MIGAVLVVIAVLSWHAGGPQDLREISLPVAVPDLPR
jgi:hypothetical protein